MFVREGFYMPADEDGETSVIAERASPAGSVPASLNQATAACSCSTRPDGTNDGAQRSSAPAAPMPPLLHRNGGCRAAAGRGESITTAADLSFVRAPRSSGEH